MRLSIVWKSTKVIFVFVLSFLSAACAASSLTSGNAGTPLPVGTVSPAAETAGSAADDAQAASETTAPTPSLDELDEAGETPHSASDEVEVTATIEAKPPPDEGAVLIYKRSGGFAGLEEGYTIYGDGRISSNTGQELQVEAQAVERLLDEVKESGFFEMAGDYMPEDSCCDRFAYELSVFDGQDYFTVSTVDAAPGVPDELWLVLDKVQQFIDNEIH
jgi:hypothetical protein